MTDLNHNHGNDTGNGNQSDSGDDEDRPERPGLLYGPGLPTLRVVPISGGYRIDTDPYGSPKDGSRIIVEDRVQEIGVAQNEHGEWK